MKEFFRSLDFNEINASWNRLELAAFCNRLIRERGKVVYGNGVGTNNEVFTGPSHPGLDTHTALLICVEEIEKDSADAASELRIQEMLK